MLRKQENFLFVRIFLGGTVHLWNSITLLSLALLISFLVIRVQDLRELSIFSRVTEILSGVTNKKTIRPSNGYLR